jgi:hypothetical protein
MSERRPRMARKGEKKTGRKTGKLVPQKHGGAILDGAAPPENHVPGPGRPPDEFKRAMRELASSDEILEHVRQVLANPDHPQWLGAWKWATERGYGKSPDSVEVSGPGGSPIPHALVVKFVKPDEE